jgi:hypothetical protein
MTKPFVIEGDLVLYCQEGGFADDAFVLRKREPKGIEEFVNAVSNEHIGYGGLDELVIDHFGLKREMPSGNTHVGWVRITIERIDAEPET